MDESATAMMERREFLGGVLLLAGGMLLGLPLPGRAARAAETPQSGDGGKGTAKGRIRIYSAAAGGYVMTEKVIRTEEEWRKLLTPEQFRIARRKGTEKAFTGRYDKHYEKGIYRCVCCGTDLFRSEAKFDSGTGWPSFYAPIAPENIRTESDRSFLMERTEVLCARCDAHLGHVFEDGPKPTGLRYCMNSASLAFAKAGTEEK
jgi:peptide-methionine (R)-S-oxide reductase